MAIACIIMCFKVGGHAAVLETVPIFYEVSTPFQTEISVI